MPLDEHDTVSAVQRFDLSAESQEKIFEALRSYDGAFNRLARMVPDDAISLSAAKYAADRAICTILGVLAEARR